MEKFLLVWASAALLMGIATSCTETTSSQNIRTPGIALIADITADSDTSSVALVRLRVGGNESNTRIILDGPDALETEVGDESKSLSSVASGNYQASFDQGAEDTEFRILLNRGEADDSATENRGTLPAPFEITSNFGAGPISRSGAELVVTWEPSGSTDDMEIEIDGDCFFDERNDIGGDPGTFTLPIEELRSTGTTEETCDGLITLSRKRNGATDSKLDSESSMELWQVRRASFVSSP